MRRRSPTRRTLTPCTCAHCGEAAAQVTTLVRDLWVCGCCWVRWCLGAETTPAPLAADAAARELVDVVPPPAELLVIGGAHV